MYDVYYDETNKLINNCRWKVLLGFGDMSLAWPAVVQLLVFIYSGIHWGWPGVLVFVCCGD